MAKISTDYLNFSMRAVVEYDREIRSTDLINPGGFEMIMNGRPVRFDFEKMKDWGICSYDKKSAWFYVCYPDLEVFPEMSEITILDLHNVSEIIEFCIDTDTSDGSSPLYPVRLKDVAFDINNTNASIYVPGTVCSSFSWEKPVAVPSAPCIVISHSFDPDVTVYEFDSDEEAERSLKQQYSKYLEEERRNHSDLDENNCFFYPDDGWGRVTWADGAYTSFVVSYIQKLV